MTHLRDVSTWIAGPCDDVRRVLRSQPRTLGATTECRTLSVLRCIVWCGLLYGSAMGIYAVVIGFPEAWPRLQQSLYSGLKVPLLLLVTFGLSLPTFFVLHSLLGLRSDFTEAVRTLLRAQAVLAVVLASLAPLTVFWYISDTGAEAYQRAILMNATVFGFASATAQVQVRREYRALIARNRRHRGMLWAWLGLYAFVGIQMGWVLRPFVGSPDAPVQFFRSGAWDNAYEIVLGLMWEMVR